VAAFLRIREEVLMPYETPQRADGVGPAGG
jgi:hypothetical protein